MNYRRLGRTGLSVSEVGFGTIPILRGSVPVLPDYYNLSDEEALTVMEHAYRLGCNLYDTAIVPEYGDAEIKLGKFAARIGREKIIISDKARFFDGNEIYLAGKASCENLGTWADLYFVHQVDAAHEEAVFQKGGKCSARKFRYFSEFNIFLVPIKLLHTSPDFPVDHQCYFRKFLFLQNHFISLNLFFAHFFVGF